MTDDFFDKAEAETKTAHEAGTADRNPAIKWSEPRIARLLLQDARVQQLKDGTMKYLLTVQDLEDGGTYTLWMGDAGDSPVMLTNGWWDATPAIGSKVMINYNGKKLAPESGYSYGLFEVRAEVNDPTYWVELAKSKRAKLELAQVTAIDNAGSQAGGVSINDLPDAF